MEANVTTCLLLCSKSQFLIKRPSWTSQIFLGTTHRRPQSQSLRAVEPSTSNNGTGNDDDTLPTIPPPVEIRFRRGSRKRSRQQQQDGGGGGGLPKAASPPKEWESMTLGEKAVELYMGEKGLLFWLNKFAYASIFIIIGAWILFRFIGPSLGLYQLDTAPLTPSAILKT